jgi:hypothetical protein
MAIMAARVFCAALCGRLSSKYSARDPLGFARGRLFAPLEKARGSGMTAFLGRANWPTAVPPFDAVDFRLLD